MASSWTYLYTKKVFRQTFHQKSGHAAILAFFVLETEEQYLRHCFLCTLNVHFSKKIFGRCFGNKVTKSALIEMLSVVLGRHWLFLYWGSILFARAADVAFNYFCSVMHVWLYYATLRRLIWDCLNGNFH